MQKNWAVLKSLSKHGQKGGGKGFPNVYKIL